MAICLERRDEATIRELHAPTAWHFVEKLIDTMMGEEGVEALVAIGDGGDKAAIKETNEEGKERPEAQLPAAERGPSPKELLTEMTRCVLHHAMLWPWVCGVPPAHLAAAAVILVRHHFKLGGGAWPSWPPALAATLPIRASDSVMRYILTNLPASLEADRRDDCAPRLNRLWDTRFAKLRMKPALPTGPTRGGASGPA
ncbi:hypothetical protein GPECTOR_1g128 [Gonium pectorale]|uniref:Cyclin C-terminal domain-containing protein n=1 Tax=Gonium pectorale TaxID=33097 RepID=A0A150H3L5_GONPE|nr:hypothetical protein GPECTOR_1g128 [Gonium pectorale]|eukprot:KXZ56150.1 hypothetical protein GPECTOR_1g128 [Gonium pectorale]